MGFNYRLKEYQKAIDAYKKAIEIKPDYHGAYCNMGSVYGELKKYQDGFFVSVNRLLILS
jgi:tetratricopeptide (TPR) repeat protein